MKQFVGSWLVIFSLSLFINAQSGRKSTIDAATAPTPTPSTVITNDTATVGQPQPSGYSESSSNKPRSGGDSSVSNKKNTPDKKDQSSPDNSETVKIETNLITIPVSVFDRNGLYIPNLQQSDFKIFEDEKEQEIAYFGTTEKPFTVILLIDVSPSTAYKIEEIRQAATAFVDELRIQDSVMVIEFNEHVKVLTELTNNRDLIYKAINKAKFGGGTSLYEAVDFSLRKRLDKIEGRKAIVLFTDGVDTTSHKADYDSTVSEAEESEATVFPIYYDTFVDSYNNGGGYSPFPLPNGGRVTDTRGTSREDYALGRSYLNDLSVVTGGRVFRSESAPGGLTDAFKGIAEELRHQYNIGYYPKDEGQAGERKQIKIRVDRPNLVIRARDSYVVGTNAQMPGSN